MQSADTLPLAISAFRKHRQVHGNYDHYAGILSLHGFSRLATETGREDLRDEIKQQLAPFLREERHFPANFKNYYCGGNATAWMLDRGLLPEAASMVEKYADEIMREAPRDPEGILCGPREPGEHKVWIDIAFAITPFLLFAGRALGRGEYIEEAYQQTAKMVAAFRYPATGLLFQSRNIRFAGQYSQDHWSRGNGWGALALAELAAHLPKDHPRRAAAVAMFRDHVESCARYQDEQGMWHQEMTDRPRSYVETSGTGLMLYALGVGLKHGLIDESERERFARGLRGLLAYISGDTDIYHTCRGCLCPGDGSKLEYRAMPPVLNDVHAFGPVILAFGQAHLLGIESIPANNTPHE